MCVCVYVCCVVSDSQLCPTLCDPLGCSPPGSSGHGILQARMEWIAIPFSLIVSCSVLCLFAQSCPTLCKPMGCSLPDSSVDYEHCLISSMGFLPTVVDTMKSESHLVMSNSLQPHGLYNPWNSSGYNTREGSSSLLQGSFPTQGSNLCLPHCRQILFKLSHQGSPRILEWVAYPFSRGFSQPGSWTGVSCIAGRFFTNLVTR